MNIDAILGNQQIFLVSGRSGSFLDMARLTATFRRSASESARIADNFSQAATVEVKLKPAGTHEFSRKDQDIQVGDTGVVVRVSDLSLSESESTVVAGGKKYVAPVFTKAAAATITGTALEDRITVSQDASGNTILKVESGGRTARIDIGKISSLTVNAGEGNDTVNINVKNYYGGITVSGGVGDDTINAKAAVSLSRGVTVYGDAGVDKVTLSGSASAALVRGGEGDDAIDARNLDGADLLPRQLYGDNGQDTIYGTGGNDVIYGGSGSDLLVAGAGNDVVYGEAGNDTVYGDAGNDMIYGGLGNDILQGGVGSDVVNGDEGDDVIMGGGTGDALWGGAGGDALYGGSSSQISLDSFLGRVQVTQLFSFLSGGEGVDTFAPSSNSPWNLAPYSGTGSHLMDYNPAVDVLV